MRPRHRAVEIVLGTYAVLVFAILWIGLVVGLANGGLLFVDAWTGLTGLEVVAQIVLWILFLPITVGLWAWNAGLPSLLAWAVVLGLIAWTLVAISGLVRAIRGRDQVQGQAAACSSPQAPDRFSTRGTRRPPSRPPER